MKMKVYTLLLFVVGCCGIQWKVMNDLNNTFEGYSTVSANAPNGNIKNIMKRRARPELDVDDTRMAARTNDKTSGEEGVVPTTKITVSTPTDNPNWPPSEIVTEGGVAGRIGGETGNDENKKRKTFNNSKTITSTYTYTIAAHSRTAATYKNKARTQIIVDDEGMAGRISDDFENDENIEGTTPNNTMTGTSMDTNTTAADVQTPPDNANALPKNVIDEGFEGNHDDSENDEDKEETTLNNTMTGTSIHTNTIAANAPAHTFIGLTKPIVEEDSAERISGENQGKTQRTNTSNLGTTNTAKENQKQRICRIGRRRKV